MFEVRRLKVSFVVLGSRDVTRLKSTDDRFQNARVLGSGETGRLITSVLGFRLQVLSSERQLSLPPDNTWWRCRLPQGREEGQSVSWAKILPFLRRKVIDFIEARNSRRKEMRRTRLAGLHYNRNMITAVWCAMLSRGENVLFL